jgi:hypothetical protein
MANGWDIGNRVEYVANLNPAGVERDGHGGTIQLGDVGVIRGFPTWGEGQDAVKVVFPNGTWDYFDYGELRLV